MKRNNIICMIPARIGSQRFKQKNLALINEKSVLEWGIDAAKNSKVFDKIIVNGDHDLFNQIAKKNNVDLGIVLFADKNNVPVTIEKINGKKKIHFLNHQNRSCAS